MGAYTNPAMIEDKSGQILAQGFKELASGIAAGVEKAAKIQNDALEARRKQIAKQNEDAADAEIKAGNAALKFKNDIANFKIENPTLITEDGLKIYDEKAKEIGDNFYNSAKIFYNPNSSSEDRKKAFEEMQKYGDGVKSLQNQVSNIQLGGNIATEYVNDSNTIYLPVKDSEGNVITTADESRDIMRAWGNGLSAGYISDDKKYSIKYDDNNNMQITFTDMDGNNAKTHTINSNSASAADQYAVKGYNGTEAIQEYSKEQGIVDDNQMFTGQYKGKTSIEVKNGVQITKTQYNGAALDQKYQQLYSKIYTELTATDAKDPDVAARRIEGFLLSRGLTPEDLETDNKPGLSAAELSKTIKEYVRDTVTPGYKIDEDGNFYTTKETKLVKTGGTGGSKPTAKEVTMKSIKDGWGTFDAFNYGNYKLEKSSDGTHYIIYKSTGTRDGSVLSDPVGTQGPAGQNIVTKFEINQSGDNSQAIYQALTTMGLPALPTF